MKKVLDFLEKNPDRLYMAAWETTREGCQTAACFGGWAQMLQNPHGYVSYTLQTNEKALDLPTGGSYGPRLFYVENWPEPFRYDYIMVENDKSAEGPAKRFGVLKARVLYFIETDGTDWNK